MRHRFGPSLYFASDKVIFDSLNQHQVNIDLVRELFVERGIIVSAQTPKEALAQYFSRLTADYFDHKSIAMKLGSVAKHERITASELSGGVNDNHIMQALQALKNRLEELGDRVDISVEQGRVRALISYEHIDYRKIDLRQVEPRDAVIEFVKEPGGRYILRSTQNKDIAPIVEAVISDLTHATSGKMVRERVNLESITDPQLRTLFFEALIKAIDGYKFLTVTEAYCFKPKGADFTGESAEDDEADEIEGLPYVERVSLRGEGVNRSFVIRDLYEKGYFIVKVVWRVQSEKLADDDIFELEAQFSSPENCTGFSYRAKSVVLVENGKPTAKRRGPKSEEEDRFFRLIEAAAKKSLSDVAK